jgi:transposase
MHVDIVPNRGSRPAYLLRESFREGGKVRKRTLANLSSLPDDQIDAIRRVLRGEKLTAATELFEVTASRIHGDTQAVLTAMKRLGIRDLLSSRPAWEAEVVMGMIAARVVAPHTKLATTRWWRTRTLPQDLRVEHATEDDLYRAMDWLLERQGTIEKKLAGRHLKSGGLALYDLTSSYFEGKTCSLAALGHNRDGKKGKLQVNYGLLADRRGCPVAVSVYEGNTNDAKTLMPQVTKLRDDFGLQRVVLVGDRGMIGQATVEDLRDLAGLEWITALKSGQIRALVEGGALQLGLFDKRNLFEVTHPDYPGERLVACRNVELGKLRAHKRQALLDATTKDLEKVRAMVERGDLRGAGKIGVRAGRVVNRHKVAKHFDLTITDDRLGFAIRETEVAAEAALDGIYVIRTSLSKDEMDGPQAVRSYKALSEVERAFRTLKTVDLEIRPIHHRLADRVRAHIFLCMLAYYVEWHMREAWRPLLFADEDLDVKSRRDPVAPAKRSESAEEKALTKRLPDGTPAHSFRTLVADLSTIVRNTCRAPGTPNAPTFAIVTTPTGEQQRAMDLLEKISA